MLYNATTQATTTKKINNNNNNHLILHLHLSPFVEAPCLPLPAIKPTPIYIYLASSLVLVHGDKLYQHVQPKTEAAPETRSLPCLRKTKPFKHINSLTKKLNVVPTKTRISLTSTKAKWGKESLTTCSFRLRLVTLHQM